MAIGKEEEAKVVLERYGRITNVKMDLTNIRLIGSALNKEPKSVSFKSKVCIYWQLGRTSTFRAGQLKIGLDLENFVDEFFT